MIAVTRKECGDSRLGSPASLSRRLTSSQIAFEVSELGRDQIRAKISCAYVLRKHTTKYRGLIVSFLFA